jgi:hypothetical protein
MASLGALIIALSQGRSIFKPINRTLVYGTAGTSRLDDKGKTQGEEASRVKVPMQETGGEQLVLVKKLL